MAENKKSNDHSEEILKILGLEKYDSFRIKDEDGAIFWIENDLNLKMRYEGGDMFGGEIIEDGFRLIANGDYEIIKIPKLIEQDKHAITFLKDCGFKFLARDGCEEEETLYAYKNMPKRYDCHWDNISSNTDDYLLLPKELFSFLKFEDEPLDISTIEAE